MRLFERLAKLPTMHFEILIGKKKDPKLHSHWKIKENRIDHIYRVLKSVDIPLGNNFINPSLPIDLIKGKYSAIISCAEYEIGAYITFVVSKILRKPFILWTGEGAILGSYTTMRKRTIFERIVEPFVRFIYEHSDSIIAYGNNTKRYLMKLGVHPRKIFVAPNTIDVDYVERLCSDQSNKIKQMKKMLDIEGKRTILFTGRLMPGKRVDLLVEAFAQLKKVQKDLSLLIVGEGPVKQKLIKTCKNFNLEDVHFIGPVEMENVFPYYMLCDVYVLPSEGGITLNEAMVCGKPIIATRNAGNVDDLIKQGVNGFIVREEDPAMLSKAIDYILSDLGKARLMGEESKKTMKEVYTIDNMINSFKNAVNFALCKKYGWYKNLQPLYGRAREFD
jgi:glycosyltransferase involved in cell wall biosynthesis